MAIAPHEASAYQAMIETTNTRLAAALLAMDCQLAADQCFTDDQVTLRISGPNDKEYVSYWYDKNWQKQNEHHPFMYVFKVSEAREWLITRVIHDRAGYAGVEPLVQMFSTPCLNIAACVIAAGYYLLWFNDRCFYFVAEAYRVKQEYENPPKDSATYWQTRYLNHLSFLLSKIGLRCSQKKKSGQKSSEKLAFQRG